MNRKILLVRHGATMLNHSDKSVDRIRGWANVPLTPEGIQDAVKAAHDIAKDPPQLLVSSDMQRAIQTAQIVSKLTGVPIAEVSEVYRPWNVGIYSGQPSREAAPILAHYACYQPNIALPQGESFDSFRVRFFSGLAAALNKFPGVIGVVSHHRNERLLDAWRAEGYPANGKVKISVFNSHGAETGSAAPMDIPVDRLASAGRGNGGLLSRHSFGDGREETINRPAIMNGII